jgi:cytochrome c-type biogenesis protein CcmE
VTTFEAAKWKFVEDMSVNRKIMSLNFTMGDSQRSITRHIEYSKFGDKFREKWGVTTEHH